MKLSSGHSENAVVITLYNGHRFKCFLSSKRNNLLQAVHDSCTHFSLSHGVDKYGLKHKGKFVDLSLPFCYTGISNNAVLELKLLAKFPRLEAVDTPQGRDEPESLHSSKLTVHVQVKFQDGKVNQGNFSPLSTLSDILEYFAKEGNSLAPTVDSLIYLQRCFKGPCKLENETLLSLGLNDGHAFFRAFSSGQIISSRNFRQSEPHVLEAKVDSRMKQDNNESDLAASNSPADKGRIVIKKKRDESLETQSSSSLQTQYESNVHLDKIVSKLRETYFDEDYFVIVKTLFKIIKNVVLKPGDNRVRQLKFSNPRFYNKVGQFTEALCVLHFVGFAYTAEEHNMQSILILDKSRENTQLLRRVMECLGKQARKLNIPLAMERSISVVSPIDVSRSKEANEEKKAENFDPFQATFIPLANQQRSNSESIVEANLATLREKRAAIIVEAGAPKRRLRLWRPLSKNQLSCRTGERPESKLDLKNKEEDTLARNDAGLLLQVTKARTEKSAAAKCFRTKAMRELEALKTARIYTETLIRVQFPDRLVVEAYFSPEERVADVIQVLNGVLIHEAKSSFYLYCTPPLKRLGENGTLSGLSLIPAALIYLAWEANKESTADFESYLCESAWKLSLNNGNDTASSIPTGTMISLGEHAGAQRSSVSTNDVDLIPDKKEKKPSWLKL